MEIPGPRTYFIFGEETDQFVLYNFQPNESVRLFAYEENYDISDLYEINVFTGGSGGNVVESLVAWQEYYVNSDGQLVISLEKALRPYVFRAVGSQSGDANVNKLHQANSVAISSPYSLSIRRPSQEEFQSIESIWNLTEYRDLKNPRTQEYNFTVASSDTWRWGYSWCAENRTTLEEILKPLSIQFLVNGEEVISPQLFLYDDIPTNGWACRRWATILSGWPENEIIELEIVYQLNSSIFDGKETFPAGEYRHILVIESKP